MKKTLLSLLVLTISFAGLAQTEPATEAPYKRFPTPPPFKLLLPDSTTHFTKDDLAKKKAVLMMVFSPDCDHCQHETEAIIKHIDELKKVQIVMATLLPFQKMKEFYVKYDLQRFANIKVGKDMNYMLSSFYDMHNLPFLAFYDKKGNLIEGIEGALPIEKVIEKFKQD